MDNLKLKEQELALLYGILLGDGCLSKVRNKYYFISVAGNSAEDMPFFSYIASLLKSLSGRDYKIKQGKGKSMQFNFTNKQMFNHLQSLKFPVGKKGTKLKIPKLFAHSTYRSIVRGYFATDGSFVIANNNGIIYPRIEFSSISRTLLLQVLNYLLELGIKGKVYLSKRYDNDPTRYTLYRLQCNGKANLEIFRHKIGFLNPKHEIRYQEFKKNAGGETFTLRQKAE